LSGCVSQNVHARELHFLHQLSFKSVVVAANADHGYPARATLSF
jgi:hypothetical protein